MLLKIVSDSCYHGKFHRTNLRNTKRQLSSLSCFLAMSNPEQAKRDYDSLAANYDQYYASITSSVLEGQLIGTALGDLTGLTVLDLGGGTGIHARRAIEQGAVAVDLVDVSPGMIKVAEDVEKSLGRNIIRVFEADVAKPLSHLPLRPEGYDVVMANWVLDFAEASDVLEAMFRNVVDHLKNGGLFVGVRVANPYSANLETGKYGVTYTRLQPFPGGVKYHVTIHCDPPLDFDAASLELLYSGSTEAYEKAGLANVEVVPFEEMRAVQDDPDYWKEFLEDPFFAVVKAVKK
jgi:ubiquinone/menaquinone biosynthesis C-methylase UbiE